MQIALHFKQMACRRNIQGALFEPDQTFARNYTQFLTADLIIYMLEEKEYDEALEQKLMAFEGQYQISAHELKKAYAKILVKLSDKIQTCVEKFQKNSLTFIGLTLQGNEFYALFKNGEEKTSIGLNEEKIRLLLGRGEAFLNENYFVADDQLIAALDFFKISALNLENNGPC